MEGTRTRPLAKSHLFFSVCWPWHLMRTTEKAYKNLLLQELSRELSGSVHLWAVILPLRREHVPWCAVKDAQGAMPAVLGNPMCCLPLWSLMVIPCAVFKTQFLRPYSSCITESLYSLNSNPPIFPSPCPWQLPFYSLLLWLWPFS